MDLQEHYDQMYHHGLEAIGSGNYRIDGLIRSASDHRLGITLLARPGEELKQAFQKFIGELKKMEPGQYYYPASDIHVTIMSIISCYEGFDLSAIDVASYVNVIHCSLANIRSFDIGFRGVTASPDAIMARGYPCEGMLEQMRNNLREAFKVSGLFSTIDTRYALFTAHSTLARFQDQLVDRKGLMDVMEQYKDHPFGSMRVSKVELVYNDWYQRSGKVRKLHQFSLD